MKNETKVGLLFLASLLLMLAFAFALGLVSPFTSTHRISVLYNYAGGLETGSPVRVMGIKVGKVKSIEFHPDQVFNNEQVKLRVVIDVNKEAWTSIRKDSRFFINLAGVIGEKFLEISTGSTDLEMLTSGDQVRGEDPPRIDQLISQSYGLAGKIIEMLEKNEGSVSNVVSQLDKLVTNFNQTLTMLDKTSKNKDAQRLIGNAIKISDDLAYFTGSLRTQEAEDTYALVHKLLFRLEDLDGPQIRKFLQQEGVKAKIF